MSIVVLKNKTKALSRATGKGGIWITQSPSHTLPTVGISGFSLQGGYRNKGRVGQDMKMSQHGTTFKGQHPVGWGGQQGRYARPEPVMNVSPASIEVNANTSMYIKPASVSNATMLHNRYRCMLSVYPKSWVQPNYTGNQTDARSQGVYIHKLATQSTARPDKEVVATNSCHGYTKVVATAMQYTDQYNNIVNRQCLNPTSRQQPFPYATQSGALCNRARPVFAPLSNF